MLRGETTRLHRAPVQSFNTSYSIHLITEPYANHLKPNNYEIIRISVVYVCNQLHVNTIWCLHTML
jgi:hypothetical protein